MIFFTLLCGCARQKSSVEKHPSGERTVARGNFVVTSGPAVAENDVEAVLLALETARRKVASRLKLPPPPETLQTVIYRTTQDFTAASGAEYYAGALYTRGVLHLQPVRVLRDRGILPQTITHEYTHFYLNVLTNGNTPAWLDEGVATLIGGEHGNCESGRTALAGFDSLESVSAALAPGGERVSTQDAYLAACFAAAGIEKLKNGAGLSRLISNLRQNRDIDSALLASTGLNTDDLFINISKNTFK